MEDECVVTARTFEATVFEAELHVVQTYRSMVRPDIGEEECHRRREELIEKAPCTRQTIVIAGSSP